MTSAPGPYGGDGFTTSRLVARTLTYDDLDELFALYRDPVLMRWITGRPRSRDETREKIGEHLDHLERHGFGLYGLWEVGGGPMIGRGGVMTLAAYGDRVGDLAWMFHRGAWGRGYATEVGRALVERSFRRFGVERVIARAHPDNRGSLRVMEKLGMHRIAATADEITYEAAPPRLRPEPGRGG